MDKCIRRTFDILNFLSCSSSGSISDGKQCPSSIRPLARRNKLKQKEAEISSHLRDVWYKTAEEADRAEAVRLRIAHREAIERKRCERGLIPEGVTHRPHQPASMLEVMTHPAGRRGGSSLPFPSLNLFPIANVPQQSCDATICCRRGLWHQHKQRWRRRGGTPPVGNERRRCPACFANSLHSH